MTLTINLNKIHCRTESNEASDSDEPYVIVTAVRLLPLPDVRCFLYGPWEMDDGDDKTIVTEPPFWGLDSTPADIFASSPAVPTPSDLLFLVSVLENDAGSPEQYRTYIRTLATAAVTASLPLVANRAARVARILDDVRSGLDGHPSNDVPFVPSDDHVGTVELVLGPSDLPPGLGTLDKSLSIDGGSEGAYDLTFRIARHRQVQFGQGVHLAAVSRKPSHLEVWGVDTTGAMRGNWLDGRWQGWYTLAGAGFNQNVMPEAVSRHDNHMEVFVVGTDGHVRGIWFEDRWHDWYSLDSLVGEPARFLQETSFAAISRRDDHMELFGVDAGGVLRHAYFWDGSWRGWDRLDLPGGELFPPGTSVTALSRHPNHMEVWVLDDNGEVRGIHFLDGTWRTWMKLDGARFPPRAHLASVSRHPDHMEVFGVDRNGDFRGCWFDGSWSAGWYSLPGGWRPGSDVAAVSRHRDRMEVWLVGRDDGIVRGNWFDDGVWHTWYMLDSDTFGPVDLTAVSRSHVNGAIAQLPLAPDALGPEAMELWCVGLDGTVRGNWFDGQWHRWYALPWSFGG